MQITGQLVEIGQLEEECGAHGVVLRTDDDRLITIKGLEPDEVKRVSHLFMEFTVITVS